MPTSTAQVMYADGPLIVGGEFVHRYHPEPAPAPQQVRPGALRVAEDLPAVPYSRGVLLVDDLVYPYHGLTYAPVARDEIAVTLEPDVEPYFGVPRRAVKDAGS